MIRRPALWLAAFGVAVCVAACEDQGVPGHVLDEAAQAGWRVDQLKAADEDFFHDMDGGLPLSPAEVQGRNTWLVWSGGNDRFWDAIGMLSYGSLDYLKTLSSHPSNTL